VQKWSSQAAGSSSMERIGGMIILRVGRKMINTGNSQINNGESQVPGTWIVVGAKYLVPG